MERERQSRAGTSRLAREIPSEAVCALSALGADVGTRFERALSPAEATKDLVVRKKRSIFNLESNLSTEATVADSFSIGIKSVLSFLSLKDNVG
ncbi:unnamed protein product [Dovyalis caffra]|uniref:Uncharacterized protein n=1 Tax=Dovyalis caffra TaxID=77055 RepID=A0AAV1R7Y3_9ROSI|nr:unnamed protein product [Dovyalis caffra]